MTDTTYNGWANYETWVANLWIDNGGYQEHYAERALELVQEAINEGADDPKADAASALASEIESDHDDMLPETSGVFSDLLTHALSSVDWREIADYYVSDIDVYSAGWNMPGCMPDNTPALFTDERSAREHISDAMTNAADEQVESSPDNREALETAALAVLKGSGEYGATIAGYHYFITKA